MIFVFGSNLRGVHGAGAAKYAKEHHGACWGVGVGHTGNSYAIPTKDIRIQTLPLSRIQVYVNNFVEYARQNPSVIFKVTQIGCGLAGYTSEQIAPMFEDAPNNCYFDRAWQDYLDCRRAKNYWN